MAFPWESQSSGHKVGGVEAPLPQENLVFLCRVGPHLCAPLLLQTFKAEESPKRRRLVQNRPSYNWTRHWIPEAFSRRPHPRGFLRRSRQWVGLMAINLTTLNARGLRVQSKCARLLGEFSNPHEDVTAVQETHFTCAADCRVLENDYVVLSAYSNLSSVGVSLLIRRSLNADVNIVLADEGGLAGCTRCCH